MRLFNNLTSFTKTIYHGIKKRIGSFFAGWGKRRQTLPPDDIQYTFRCRSYPGSRTRRYRVHIPPQANKLGPLPLVMVLHGCRQDNEDIEHISNFNQVADESGFIVAYPFVTSYRGMRITNCWGWWFDREIHRGAGEVEDLWQIIEEISTYHKIDKMRIHVTGLSSGAGMTVAMLVAHADKIASGAAVAGLPYTERPEAVRHLFNRRPRHKPIHSIVSAMRAELGDNPRTVPLKIVHSLNDQTVDIQSAKNLRDSWAQCFGIDLDRNSRVEQGVTENTDWQRTLYLHNSDLSIIETLFINGPGHGWYGGRAGEFSFPDAPDISRSIWNFFDTHRFAN